MATTGGGKNVTIPQSAFKRIKDEAKEKGKAEAMSSLNDELKQHGFNSIGELAAALANVRKGGSGNGNGAREDRSAKAPDGKPAEPSGHQRDNPKAWEKYERDIDRWRKQADSERRARQVEVQRRRDAERQRDATEARRALERAAYRAGVQNVDYAIHLLTQHLEGRSEKELESFDEGKFFEGLRAEHPYLFGEVRVAATTGTGATQPATPKPAAVAATAAKAGAVDTRKMNRDEYQAYLRSRGLQVPGGSTPGVGPGAKQ